MPNGVTLISEKGAPLSCAEVDANYLALLDRGNHMGTQSASTIYDLESTVSSFTNIGNLQTNLTDLMSQVADLQYQVMADGGHLDITINSLESSIADDLSTIRASINTNSNNISLLQEEDINLHTRIDNLLAGVELDIASIEDLLQCLEDGTCVLVPSPPDEQGDLLLGYDDETNALVWGLPIHLFCGPIIEQAFEIGKNSRLDLGTF
jgi:hypothetical protein